MLTWSGHVVLHFSRLQDAVALSTGEAELKSGCKGMSEALGLRSLCEFLMKSPVVLVSHLMDASAMFGILRRRGAGPVKHLETRQLWCQELFTLPGDSTQKINRRESPADLLWSSSSSSVLTGGIEHIIGKVGVGYLQTITNIAWIPAKVRHKSGTSPAKVRQKSGTKSD